MHAIFDCQWFTDMKLKKNILCLKAAKKIPFNIVNDFNGND